MMTTFAASASPPGGRSAVYFFDAPSGGNTVGTGVGHVGVCCEPVGGTENNNEHEGANACLAAYPPTYANNRASNPRLILHRLFVRCGVLFRVPTVVMSSNVEPVGINSSIAYSCIGVWQNNWVRRGG